MSQISGSSQHIYPQFQIDPLRWLGWLVNATHVSLQHQAGGIGTVPSYQEIESSIYNQFEIITHETQALSSADWDCLWSADNLPSPAYYYNMLLVTERRMRSQYYHEQTSNGGFVSPLRHVGDDFHAVIRRLVNAHAALWDQAGEVGTVPPNQALANYIYNQANMHHPNGAITRATHGQAPLFPPDLGPCSSETNPINTLPSSYYNNMPMASEVPMQYPHPQASDEGSMSRLGHGFDASFDLFNSLPPVSILRIFEIKLTDAD